MGDLEKNGRSPRGLAVHSPMEKKEETAGIRYRESFSVRSCEVDPAGMARLTAIANYFQEVAHNHANRLGVGYRQLKEKQTLWVLSRMRMHFFRYPAWEEVVTVETWPSGIDKLFALRDFRMLCNEKELLCTARSAWLILRADGRRPVRPENEPFFRELRNKGLAEGLPEEDPEMAPEGSSEGSSGDSSEGLFEGLPAKNVVASEGRPLEKLPVNEAGENRTASLAVHQVAWSDLDVMGHVNNVKYMDWCLDRVLKEEVFGIGAPVSEFEINYLHEALPDERIELRTYLPGPGKAFIVAKKEGEGKEIFRARITAS